MINILYCTDDKLFTQQLISLISVVKHTNEPLNVINLTLEVKEYKKGSKRTSSAQEKILDDLVKSKNPQSRFKCVDVSDEFRKIMKGPNLNNRFYTYFVVVRLLADLVKEIEDKCIYLDCDVILNRDIKELWDVDVTDYEFAGRKDLYRITNYLQSGIMVLNMKRIRESGSFGKCREYLMNKKVFAYLDMTPINMFCSPKLRLPIKYNSYDYSKDCIAHHVCSMREGKIPLTKKWRHRIKIDERELFLKFLPQYQYLYDEYDRIISENKNAL